MTITVQIKGFNNISEAQDFCDWYSGQGEQDASIWYECRVDEGIHSSTTMDCKTIKKINDETIEMTLDCRE